MNKFLTLLLLIAYRKNNVAYNFDDVYVLNNKLINEYIKTTLEKENNIEINICKCFVNKLYNEKSPKRLTFIIQTKNGDYYLVCNGRTLAYESGC